MGHAMGAVLLPVVTQMPVKWLYPLGKDQGRPPSNKYSRFYEKDLQKRNLKLLVTTTPRLAGGRHQA
jgi:hypothetical protein